MSATTGLRLTTHIY